MGKVTERPQFVTDEHLSYLDDLSESGAINMFAAGVWLKDAFGLDRESAKEVLMYWMKTFSARQRG